MKSQLNFDMLHRPVLVGEVIEALNIGAHLNNRSDNKIESREKYIDATVGLGGHSVELIKRNVDLLGIDADENSLKIAKKRLEKACPALNDKVQSCFKLVHDNFRKIDSIAESEGFSLVDGILFDLGVSSYQLVSKKRGFSFHEDSAYLDMRIDSKSQEVTAADLLNSLDRKQLVKLFGEVINRKSALNLARRIIETRKIKKVESVSDFKAIINTLKVHSGKLDSATLPFMALRIAVNSEIDNLEEALPKAINLLSKGGRLVVISFHSGEDKVVKQTYKDAVELGVASLITRKPIIPNRSEILENPRSRSAKLRVLEKI